MKGRSGLKNNPCGIPVKIPLTEDILLSILTNSFFFLEVGKEPFIGYAPYTIVVKFS